MENEGYTPNGSAWLAAVDKQEDDAAEALVANLTAADEPMLLAFLQETDANRQWWAIRALGACGSEASLGALLPFLKTDHDELRAVVIMALGNVGQR
ncbi:MAG TPA: HEAT repeat domain-containing protein, partial [Caldilineaceae bacterium]|nr:HEAT repeat domain-containing protein [Caldilineaceae bacterium]